MNAERLQNLTGSRQRFGEHRLLIRDRIGDTVQILNGQTEILGKRAIILRDA